MSSITRWFAVYEGNFEENLDVDKKWPANSSILELRMFDVGAGEAIFIIFPSRTAWLIDGGSSAKGKDTGEMLANYLIERNLTLTRIIASHTGFASLVEATFIYDRLLPFTFKF